jgi:hypothetical protein
MHVGKTLRRVFVAVLSAVGAYVVVAIVLGWMAGVVFLLLASVLRDSEAQTRIAQSVGKLLQLTIYTITAVVLVFGLAGKLSLDRSSLRRLAVAVVWAAVAHAASVALVLLVAFSLGFASQFAYATTPRSLVATWAILAALSCAVPAVVLALGVRGRLPGTVRPRSAKAG